MRPKKKKSDEAEQPETLGAEITDDLSWDEDGEDEDGGDDELAEEQTVERPLTKAALQERRIELADTTSSILDLEDKRKELLTKINGKLKSLKKRARTLATEIKLQVERVPAQQELLPAKKARRLTQRSVQDNGAPVEP